MIKSFEQYNKIDPYNEEIWNDLYDYENIMKYLSTLNSKDIVYTEDKTRSFLFTPNVLAVRFYTKLEYGQKEYCLYLPPFYHPLDLTSEESRKIYKYMENKHFKELNEKNLDVDPYGEENWEEQEKIKIGDEILEIGDKIVNKNSPRENYGIIINIEGNSIRLSDDNISWEVSSGDLFDWLCVSKVCRVEKID